MAIAGCLSLNAFGQENANKQAIAQQNAQGHFGSFTHKEDATHNVSVSYAFTPLQPASTVDFRLIAAAPRPLTIKIYNAKGKLVQEFIPTESSAIIAGQLDVSALPKGKYEYRIYWGTELAKKISFDKK